MIDLMLIICLLVVSVYLLEQIAGFSVLSDAVRYICERSTKYRVPDPDEGFYSPMELDDFAKAISSFFTTITCTGMRYDKYGWQFAEFEIIPPTSGIMPGLQQAVSIEARNYLKTHHGYDNPDIFVTVLCDNFMCLRVACSKKSHALARNLDFSPLPKNHGSIDEEVK